MEPQFKNFPETAKGFSKNPLGIIALFIVLIYGLATFAYVSSDFSPGAEAPMTWFLILFPVIVFIGFLWLVSRHHDKLYSPSDFKNEDNFIRMKLTTVASLSAATTQKTQTETEKNMLQEKLDKIVELVSEIPSLSEKAKYSGKNILWIDDHPEKIINERHAFESQGVRITTAESTSEALDWMAENSYDVIISDMKRSEGLDEGYRLLEIIRSNGNQTPYFIYSGSDMPEHQLMALEKGAQGSTNQAQELFSIVMGSLHSRLLP